MGGVGGGDMDKQHKISLSKHSHLNEFWDKL